MQTRVFCRFFSRRGSMKLLLGQWSLRSWRWWRWWSEVWAKEEPLFYSQGQMMGQGETGLEQIFGLCNWRRGGVPHSIYSTFTTGRSYYLISRHWLLWLWWWRRYLHSPCCLTRLSPVRAWLFTTPEGHEAAELCLRSLDNARVTQGTFRHQG